MDEVGASVKLHKIKIPDSLKKLEAEMSEIVDRKEIAAKKQDYENAAIYRDKQRNILALIEQENIKWKEQLKQSYSASEDDLEYIENEFSGFCKNQQLKRALLDSVDLLKGGEYDSIRFLIDSALKAGQDKNIGHEYDKDTESRYREDNRVIIPTPWDKINELIQGGLGNGDFGLVFGNPGGGKSWALVALGGCAVQLGYNVVHYTLELGEDYVGKRYDAFFTGIPVDKLKNFKSKVQETITELPGKLIIKEYI
jgi:hypothetical protein